MPSTPRGRDAATILAVLLAIALAFAWLRSSDGAVPAVPAGLSVETVPAVAPEEPAALADAASPARGIEGTRGGGDHSARRARHTHADRAGGGEDARAPVGGTAGEAGGGGARTRRGTAGEAGGQDPPATTPAPAAGAGTAGGGGASAGAANGGGGTSAPSPEFALE